MLDLSVVIACYCEEDTVEELYTRLASALYDLPKSIEIIYVNDGSTDSTLAKLLAIQALDPHVTVIDLVRNAGQWPAMTAGLCEARGRAIAFLDSDLQLDPADLPALLSKYDEGYELVSGQRYQRRDTLLRKTISRLGNFLLRGVTKGQLHDLGCAMKVFDGNYVRAFDFGPMMPFRPLQVISAMTKVAELPVSHHAREFGSSNWGSRVLIKNFSLAALDLLQGRIRTLGINTAAIGIGIGFASLLLSLASAPFAGIMGWLSLFLFIVGHLLMIWDQVILGMVTRRVQPAYVVKHIHRREGSGRDE
jgi:glycosyltransferase involved in cell wall biosynthesis